MKNFNGITAFLKPRFGNFTSPTPESGLSGDLYSLALMKPSLDGYKANFTPRFAEYILSSVAIASANTLNINIFNSKPPTK